MATPSHLNYSYLAENPIKPKNGISIWAFLLSIFIYISVFYIFNLSPSTLFNTTKFWFFISSTLILILAADSGAFSSSENHDLCEEYVKHSPRVSNNSSSFESKYSEIFKESIPQQEVIAIQNSQEKKEIIVVHERQSPEINGYLLEKFNTEKPENSQEKMVQVAPKVDSNEAHEKKKNEASFVRSVSDKAIPVIGNDNQIILRRSETEKCEPNQVEENEFSTMSNEELNRRVEEFIQRFNRQIRLQAASRKFHQI